VETRPPTNWAVKAALESADAVTNFSTVIVLLAVIAVVASQWTLEATLAGIPRTVRAFARHRYRPDTTETYSRGHVIEE
jgi:hypothetical protein